ncbi:hypothetical protein P4S91_22235 [Aneurinibacillus aneurinilyticus]|uniref:hypothetical protein n=1 Tax=Aneurinibacillus aneurinilyticus TaxID=1391 RepID=UPI002E1AF7AD|nr:hypothetical protein [Aneurinibacillus aneurinilyticus]MED0725606.1 hypothetical protein [Aneurinibacillus aneurinilyticus]
MQHQQSNYCPICEQPLLYESQNDEVNPDIEINTQRCKNNHYMIIHNNLYTIYRIAGQRFGVAWEDSQLKKETIQMCITKLIELERSKR